MKKINLTASFLTGAILLILVVLPLGCTGGETSANLKVVTTTSLIASIVEKVGGDKVDVVNIIPPAQCPGHFDVKPSDMKALSDAKLFLLHGWQGEMFSTDLIKSADNPGLKVVSLNIPGNWMTPTVQAQAVGNITSALSEIDPNNASYYQSNAESEFKAISAKDNELKVKLAAGNLSHINVLCDAQITDLVQWAGFNVIASYPRPEDISAKQMQELIDQGKQGGVVIVMANLQSGTPDAAVTMANGIGAVQVTLSNFPGGFDNTETWEKALEEDVNLMLEAAATYQGNSH